jgi:predicted metalloprotease
VRTELQADCYQADIATALDAAAVWGRQDPARKSWTHGLSAERQRRFTVGHQTDEPSKCNTFSGSL